MPVTMLASQENRFSTNMWAHPGEADVHLPLTVSLPFFHQPVGSLSCTSNRFTPMFRLSPMSTHTIISSSDRLKLTGLIILFISMLKLEKRPCTMIFLSTSGIWPLVLEPQCPREGWVYGQKTMK